MLTTSDMLGTNGPLAVLFLLLVGVMLLAMTAAFLVTAAQTLNTT